MKLLLALLQGRDEHSHLSALKNRLLVDAAVLLASFSKALKDLLAQALVSHLTTLEPQANAHLVAASQETDCVIRLCFEVMGVNTTGQLNFLYFHSRLLFLSIFFFLVALIAVFTVIHSAAYRRSCLRGDKNQVYAVVECIAASLAQGHNAELIAVLVQHTSFFYFDLLVDQQFLCYN